MAEYDRITELEALAEALKNCKGPDRTLDAFIAYFIDGWNVGMIRSPEDVVIAIEKNDLPIPEYTNYLSVPYSLAKERYAEWEIELGDAKGYSSAVMTRDIASAYTTVYAEGSRPLSVVFSEAIVRLALRIEKERLND